MQSSRGHAPTARVSNVWCTAAAGTAQGLPSCPRGHPQGILLVSFSACFPVYLCSSTCEHLLFVRFGSYICPVQVILATNIAETSITINGIKHVVDIGMVKQRVFNPKTSPAHCTLSCLSAHCATDMDVLSVVAVSKAQVLLIHVHTHCPTLTTHNLGSAAVWACRTRGSRHVLPLVHRTIVCNAGRSDDPRDPAMQPWRCHPPTPRSQCELLCITTLYSSLFV